MLQFWFIFLLFLGGIIRGPLSLLLIPLKFLIKPLSKRIDFERKNFLQQECRSFKLDFIFADYCFEVASEGELEQVLPLMEYYLKQGKKIEIIFSSPAVELKCERLGKEYKNQMRILRLPLASFFPFPFLFFQSLWSWVTAPVILFCRYDFYPELLSLKFFKKRLVLLSGAMKNPTWFKKQSMLCFDFIVAVNHNQARLFQAQKLKAISFDFRIPRILKRQSQADDLLRSIPELTSYLDFLDLLPAAKKLIMGSAWKSDLLILKNQEFIKDLINGEMHLLIVPHLLKVEAMDELKKSLRELGLNLPIYEIKTGLTIDIFSLKKSPGIVILNMNGILCEFYSKFQRSYVGGGFERSVHSVLEPFLSGNLVFVGPKILRSTEYDFVYEMARDEIYFFDHPENFYQLLKEKSSLKPNLSIREKLKREGDQTMDKIIKEIELC